MNNCVSRFIFPIFLFYVGFILLGGLIGLIVGLIVTTILVPAIVIGIFIGLALALIAQGITNIIINRTCYNNFEYNKC